MGLLHDIGPDGNRESCSGRVRDDQWAFCGVAVKADPHSASEAIGVSRIPGILGPIGGPSFSP